ncbi:ABC transporter permease [Algoriphagus sediminis]|uniref:ABC transporter permease n=1 Tax=Algoriphagus sediminis TaxID=3057113 RepID=A0ABT7Y9Q5_9BACT|nr:ABC transporter permease [Algoriphagus sediminis]MDN3203253.1 ABC transporter permease [Algoriphagus sediminis]
MKNSREFPPKFAMKFFEWFCKPSMHDFIEGDLLEEYFIHKSEMGQQKADLKFIRDVFFLFRPGIIKPIKGFENLTTAAMYKSYFKIGYRNLIRNKGFSFINIGGLAFGMCVAILIALWVHNELTYNTYHKNYDRLAQVLFRSDFGGDDGIHVNSSVPTGLGTHIQDTYQAQFKNVAMCYSRPQEIVITSGKDSFLENGYYMQPNAPEMLSLEMMAGTLDGLKDLKTIMISQSLAEKIFGDRDPIGQEVRFNEQVDALVTGVFKDIPRNSEFFDAQFIAPLDVFLYGWSDLNVWDNQNMRLYVELHEGVDLQTASAIIKDAYNTNIDKNHERNLFLHPMKDWHLKSEWENGVSITSAKQKFIWIFSALGIAVLVLACVNFMNLSTARSESRAKEIGVRKTMGSLRNHLTHQFLTESVLVALFAFILSLGLLVIVLPWFNELAAKDISAPWLNPVFWIAGLFFTLITGLLAGSYPALYLSSFNPIKSLKGGITSGRQTSLPRKVLVIFQFCVSFIVIMGTIVIYQQIQHVKNRPVGYEREGLLMMPKNSDQLWENFRTLRQELFNTGVVEEIGEANYPLTNTFGNNDGFSWGGPESDKGIAFNTIRISPEYGKAVGWEVLQGRDFNENMETDKAGVIITESALAKMGLEDPIGKTVLTEDEFWGYPEFTIIGVVRDLIKGDPFEDSSPGIMFLSDRQLYWQFIRIKEGIPFGEALETIGQTYKRVAPEAYTDLKVLEDEYLAKFESQEQIGEIGAFLSGFAIFISCLGLFGLASFLAEKRSKEIGLRKVLGASTANLWQLLTKDFFILVLVASLIASPIAYYLMEKWLSGFDYKMDIPLSAFLFTCFGAMLITLLTVGFQAVKTALANPVKSIRTE